MDLNNRRITFDINDATDVVDCTFTNQRLTGAILITRTYKHATGGPGDLPQSGVTFTITGGSLQEAVQVTTDANGEACLDGLGLSSFSGDYTVTENVPSGYSADTPWETVSVTQESSCGDGQEATVSFHNTPLTNITVAVDSQVNGGTASTINCVIGSAVTNAAGDAQLTLSNLEPGTYVCTIVVDPKPETAWVMGKRHCRCAAPCRPPVGSGSPGGATVPGASVHTDVRRMELAAGL